MREDGSSTSRERRRASEGGEERREINVSCRERSAEGGEVVETVRKEEICGGRGKTTGIQKQRLERAVRVEDT